MEDEDAIGDTEGGVPPPKGGVGLVFMGGVLAGGATGAVGGVAGSAGASFRRRPEAEGISSFSPAGTGGGVGEFAEADGGAGTVGEPVAGSAGGASDFGSGGRLFGAAWLLPAAGLTMPASGELLGTGGIDGGAEGLAAGADDAAGGAAGGRAGASSFFASGTDGSPGAVPGKLGGRPGGGDAEGVAGVSALRSGGGGVAGSGIAGADVGGKLGAARSAAAADGAVTGLGIAGGGAGGPLFAATSGGAFGASSDLGGGLVAQPLLELLGGAAGLPPKGVPPDSDATWLTAGTESAGLVAFRGTGCSLLGLHF